MTDLKPPEETKRKPRIKPQESSDKKILAIGQVLIDVFRFFFHK